MRLNGIEDDATLLMRLRYEWAGVRMALLERKYRADQPRVPAGSPEGGEWMDGDVAHFTPIARRTIQRMPVDLEKEDGSGGHGKRDHVGRSNSELVRTLSEERLDTSYNYVLVGRRFV